MTKSENMEIRLETPEDYLKVENLVRDSFWNVYRPGAYEHYIVHNLRNDESFINDLAYVIENDGEIIGHINYSNGKLNFRNGKCCKAPILGPISIAKDHQNKGYGSKLIEHTLNLIENKDISCVFVVGDENYYQRFGFESASKYNLHLEGTDTAEECPFFMIKIFDREMITSDEAIFSNPDVFDVDKKEVDEFDKKFEYKKKEVREGQLD